MVFKEESFILISIKYNGNYSIDHARMTRCTLSGLEMTRLASQLSYTANELHATTRRDAGSRCTRLLEALLAGALHGPTRVAAGFIR